MFDREQNYSVLEDFQFCTINSGMNSSWTKLAVGSGYLVTGDILSFSVGLGCLNC